MGEFVSLSKVKKAKARSDKEAVAAGNRAKFGRTKGEKLKDEAEKVRAQGLLDGHKRDDE